MFTFYGDIAPDSDKVKKNLCEIKKKIKQEMLTSFNIIFDVIEAVGFKKISICFTGLAKGSPDDTKESEVLGEAGVFQKKKRDIFVTRPRHTSASA